MSFERITAHICTIQEIISAPFVKLEGLESSYLVTPYGNVSRVNVLGVVVDIEEQGITLEDGSGKILLRIFEPLRNMPQTGQLVLVIGKPRVYNNEKIIIPEIVKHIENNKWIEHRKIELTLRKIIQDPEKIELPKKEIEDMAEIKEESKSVHLVKKESSAEKIIRLIREKDTGKGVSITELETLQLDNFEKVLMTMLEEGDIYEIRSGYVKVLD
jgi:RPA family protein